MRFRQMAKRATQGLYEKMRTYKLLHISMIIHLQRIEGQKIFCHFEFIDYLCKTELITPVYCKYCET